MKKKYIIMIAVGGALLVSILILSGWYIVSRSVVEQQQPEASNESVTYDRVIERGIAAEERGETQTALDSFKEARAMCTEDDVNCKTDMDMKILMLEGALKTEKEVQSMPETVIEGEAREPTP